MLRVGPGRFRVGEAVLVRCMVACVRLVALGVGARSRLLGVPRGCVCNALKSLL